MSAVPTSPSPSPPSCDGVIPALDVLCPMHVIVNGSGHVVHAGPTLQKLRPDTPMAGTRFLELFELIRPRAVGTVAELLASSGIRLKLKFRDAPMTAFKGVLVPMPECRDEGCDESSHFGGGVIVNLSFGISVLDAVHDYALTGADFAATDLTIEMLYLVEAKSAAMEASRTLNTRLQGAMIAAEEQAFTDTLTGLKNRRAMDHVLSRLIASGRDFAVMNIDLDYFKAVNDTLGHAAGDHVLQQVARIMVEETRAEDTVARVGGDEFVLLFDGLTDRETLDKAAQRIIRQLEKPIQFGAQTCHISASCGTALAAEAAGAGAAELLEAADLALYASKRKGRACHTFFDPTLRDDAGAAAMRPPVAVVRKQAARRTEDRRGQPPAGE